MPEKSVSIVTILNNILTELGYPAETCYVASNLWKMRSGSAVITIAYNKDTGFIFGDAVLCSLPPDPSNNLLTFLLSQNNEPGKIRLAIENDAIMLSWTAYDKYFTEVTARNYIEEHIREANRLDNILVAEYGCKWM